VKRPILTIAETARVLKENVKHVRRAVKAGDLPSIRIGSRSYVITAKLEALLGTEIPSEFFSESPESREPSLEAMGED